MAALTALAPRLTPGEEQADPAAQLAIMLDPATQNLRPGNRARARVAGLVPTPAEPISDDMRAALAQRQELIENVARQLLQDAEDVGDAWVARLGRPSSRPEVRERWEAHAATVALYRYRYEITGPSSLGDAKTIATADQAAEYRAAKTALRGVQRAGQQSTTPLLERARQREARHTHRL